MHRNINTLLFEVQFLSHKNCDLGNNILLENGKTNTNYLSSGTHKHSLIIFIEQRDVISSSVRIHLTSTCQNMVVSMTNLLGRSETPLFVFSPGEGGAVRARASSMSQSWGTQRRRHRYKAQGWHPWDVVCLSLLSSKHAVGELAKL